MELIEKYAMDIETSDIIDKKRHELIESKIRNKDNDFFERRLYADLKFLLVTEDAIISAHALNLTHNAAQWEDLRMQHDKLMIQHKLFSNDNFDKTAFPKLYDLYKRNGSMLLSLSSRL